MKIFLILIPLFIFGCVSVPTDPTTPPSSNSAMGYDPDPVTGQCSSKAVPDTTPVEGKCYDEENFRKLCDRNTYRLDNRCAGFIDRPGR